jgi:hypothetical protein
MGKEPLLLFIQPALSEIMLGTHAASTLPEITPIPDFIYTPLGIGAYPGINKLTFISIPYIDEIGRVGRIQMRNFYLDTIINTMAKQLQLSFSDFINSLLNYSRIANVGALVADKPMLLLKNSLLEGAMTMHPSFLSGSLQLPEPTYDEYYPFYWNTNIDMDDVGIIKELQSNIIYCLNNHLNALPSSIVDSWIKTTLNPIMTRLKSAMKQIPKTAKFELRNGKGKTRK